MNIFFLDYCPDKAAKYHVDKHVVKMILESAQLLSTAHRILDGDNLDQERQDKLYKRTHINHPSAIWVRESIEHYNWLYNLFLSLAEEHKYRYNRSKYHLSYIKLKDILKYTPNKLNNMGWREPPPTMPPDCIVYHSYGAINSVASYRKYYNQYKRDLFQWTKRSTPNWIVSS